MISAFISAFFFLSIFLTQQDIGVEHVYLDRINTSSIADQVIHFDLKEDFTNIQDLVITQDFYFISPGEEKSKGFSTSVSKLDKSGKYLGEIYRSETGSLISDLAYNPSTKSLIISHNQKIVLLNVVTNKIIKEVEIDKRITRTKIFKSKLYVAGFNYTDDSEIYYLDIYDPLSLKLIETKKEMKYVLADKAFRHSSLSSKGDELFVSMGAVNEIYSSADGFKKPIITFKNIYKNKPSLGNILFSSNQGLVGKFATTGFKYLNNYYIYYYDLNAKKQYLSKTGENSGLYDDINNIGHIRNPRFTNANEYMFSTKKDKLNEKGITVILLKIKS
ncbi:hypothetical protein [Algoriphagus aquimarinus]|uniref:6-bladed beta-propeller n=1 Tax=Algoriphagus aquimarinus TaxID=237018 RepID=A0A1I0ZJB1_9BACT|nr:hypothetical protein [Algoriphagus aquimarinus]SFB25869.1 hypothetical protein SAMN04489723_106149 [Algoriphagus aquimarinus]